MADSENPSAFPSMLTRDSLPSRSQPGMTLRDWFAAQVDLTPYDAFATYRRANSKEPTVAELAAYIAQIRFVEADAMLAARSTPSRSHP